MVKEACYTLQRRRPSDPQHLMPETNGWVDSQTVTFEWQPALRATSYRLLVATAPPTPQNALLDITLDGDTTTYSYTFDQAYPQLYAQVLAINELGSVGGYWPFGIDVNSPVASVTALPTTTVESQFAVSWHGSDDASGVRWYDVQYRDGERGEWTDWLVHTVSTEAIFKGKAGHTYYFRVRALDNAGNLEGWPTGDGDTYTTVDPAARPPTPWWNDAYASKRNLLILNNADATMVTGYPVHLHFDDETTPTAAELYAASQSANKGDDFRIVYDNSTELARWVQRFSPTEIDIWFKIQTDIAPHSSTSDDYQLYYGYAGAADPPGTIDDVMPPGRDENTVGLWHFADGAGSTFVDSSGRGHNGTLVGDYSWGEDAWGPYLEWFGGGDNAARGEVGSSPDFDLNEMTLEAWVYVMEGWTPEMTVFYRPKSDNAPGYKLAVSDLKVDLQLNGAHGRAIGGDQMALNRWYHIAGTFDGSNMRIYLNGVLVRTVPYDRSLDSTAGRILYVGGSPYSQTFRGRVRHLRISNTARSDFSYAANILAVDPPPSVAVGDPIERPVSGSADLAIYGLTAYPRAAPQGGGLIVQAVVHNEGNLSTPSGFYVDLYADHLPVGAGDYTGSVRFWINDPIAAGATITLTTIITDLGTAGVTNAATSEPPNEVSATLYAQADSTGVISEPDEGDNISAGVDVCAASTDAYEDDDTVLTAQPIALGEDQSHNFDSVGDEDWVRFVASQDVTYVVRTDDLGPSADTYLYLYDTDGSSLLAANDDYGGTLASLIQWRAPAAGTYYVRVRHWNPTVGGCGTGYRLMVYQEHRVCLPVVMRD